MCSCCPGHPYIWASSTAPSPRPGKNGICSTNGDRFEKTLTIALFCLNLKVSFFEIREVYDMRRYIIYIRGVSSVLVRDSIMYSV